MAASVPQEPASKLAEVVAGDVLHHAAAGFEGLAAPGDGGEAEKMVARGAGLDAPRPGEICRRAHRRSCRARRTTEKRPVIHRLEGQLLAACGSSASISASGVPAFADSTSSSGS